ncbi:hypothetical protein [Demequina sp.]|uniref:hypothetical protein n=1 Tax=Demequina sp. TaxID=2050685 RepID=UPI003D11F426
MTRLEIALEVAPIDAPTVQRLKDAGLEVYKGNRTWRVVAYAEPNESTPVRQQAINLANDILIDFRLDPLHRPPTVTLRYPDGETEQAVGDLLLEDARRASDPDPLPRPKRKWWQKQMELGLGERKGD